MLSCLSLVFSTQFVNGQSAPNLTTMTTQTMNLTILGNITTIQITDNTYGGINIFETLPAGYTYIYAVDASYTFDVTTKTSSSVEWFFTNADGSTFNSTSNPLTTTLNSPTALTVIVSPTPQIFGTNILNVIVIIIIVVVAVFITLLAISKKRRLRRT